MKKLIYTFVLTFLSTNTIAQSNLSSFEVVASNGHIYSGYAEPKNPLTDGNSTLKSRIFVFPRVILKENSLVVRNESGDKVSISNYS